MQVSKPMTVAKLVKQANKIKEKIAKERDSLRDVHAELGSILESTEEGLDDMESAIDKLGQYL